jgi:polysaccharide deacetylase family protein (PEP-CTERM system associated)
MTAHALTIDLEDWHQLLGRRLTGEIGPSSAAVERCTHRLLDMLGEAGVHATFFVVGVLARARPELVREVARRGHEIGSHTHSHRLIYSLERDDFRDEMTGARKALQDLTGQPIIGFRAPEFSVGRLDHWCFDVLAEVGFEYDSSVVPVRARYGIPDAPTRPFVIETLSGSIAEFPLASWQVGSKRVPMAGGTYWRLLPRWFLNRAIRELDRAKIPAVLYFHPYEFSRELLHLFGLGPRSAVRGPHVKYVLMHNFLTGRITRSLRPLLGRFSFEPLGEIYRAMPRG